MNLRGRYQGGGWTVTCKHWWSPKSRRSARTTALILEHERPNLEAKIKAHLYHALVYGVCLPFDLTSHETEHGDADATQ